MASESFELCLREATDCLRMENEEAHSRFVTKVARLCDTTAMSASAIARALRSVHSGDTPKSSSRAQNLDALGLGQVDIMMRSAPIDFGPTKSHESGISAVSAGARSGGKSPARHPSSHFLKLRSMSQAQRKSQGQRKSSKERSSTASEISKTTQEDLIQMHEELKVQHCKFLTKDGKIVKPRSDWINALGPHCGSCVAKWVRRFEDRVDAEIPDTVFSRLVHSAAFKVGSTLAISLNYIFILVATDWRMRNLGKADPGMFRVFDLGFTGYYVLELMLNIIALKSHFFFGADCSWNWFDFIIVFLSILQEIMNLFSFEFHDTSFLRVLRFFRISKLLRMFEAMRMFKEIKIMVDSIMGSFMAFAMCVLMLAMYLSIFAIFFIQGWTAKLEDQSSSVSAHLKDQVKADFGGVVDAMRSLFMALTGGNDWQYYFDIIKELGLLYMILFLFFFLFALMSFFNVITGVFCEKAMSLARPGLQESMVRRYQKELHDATELIMLLKKVLGVHEPFPPIGAEDFKLFLEHEEVVTYFDVRGLNVASANRFFKTLIDISASRHVDVPTFVSSCVKLDGPASSIDLHVMDMQVKAVGIAISHMRLEIESRLDTMSVHLDSLPATSFPPTGRTSGPDHISHTSATSALERADSSHHVHFIPQSGQSDAVQHHRALFSADILDPFINSVSATGIPNFQPSIPAEDEARPQSQDQSILQFTPHKGAGIDGADPVASEKSSKVITNICTYHYV